MSAPRPPKVLLVDDDPRELESIGDALYASGWHVQLLQHPTLAVATARTFQPDLVVLDLAMPILSGREVALALRSFADTAALPFVMLTDGTSLKDDLRLLQAGAVDLWRKPFRPEYLTRLAPALHHARTRAAMPPRHRARLALIDLAAREALHGTVCLNPGTPFEGRAVFVHGALHLAHMGHFTGEAALDEMLGLDDTVWRFEDGVTAESAARAPAAAASGALPRVLLVEDQPDLRTLAARQLERAGFKVDTAEHGEQGFEKARANDYDAIVADLNMPVLDGWGMLRLLRTDPRTREVPVLFLSAHDDYRETLKAAKAGAHDYLPKTGRSDELIRRVRALTAPRQATRAMLEAGQEVGSIELTAVGPVWLLKVLAELESTCAVDAVDDLEKWHFELEKGRLKQATAKIEEHTHEGHRALLTYLGIKGGMGFVRPAAPEGGDLGRHGWLFDELDRACRRAAEADARVAEQALGQALHFEVDAQLYPLFLQVASDRDVRLARALCEERVPPAGLAERLSLPAEEVREGLRELVRRGVVTPAAPGQEPA